MEIIKQILVGIIAGSFLAIVGCIVPVWFQQLHTTTVEAQNQTMLILEILTPQSKYLQGEPIPLDFKLLNKTNVPIMWNGIIDIDTDILARTANGNEVRWSNNRHNVDIVGETEVMQPEKSKKLDILIGREVVERLFPQPGHYQLRVEFKYLDFSYGQRQNITIVSNSIPIDIDEPRGADRRACDYLKNVYDPINRSSNINEIMRLRQHFADNFSNNVYWKYMTFELANTYLALGKNEEAEREFLKISEIEFYYSKQIEKQFQLLSRKLGRDKRNRARRRGVPTDVPVARPMPAPTIIPVPLPNNPPVRIPIPNPTP
jgi:hypothetical protein